MAAAEHEEEVSSPQAKFYFTGLVKKQNMPRMKSAAATATKRSMGKRINEDASERHGGKYKGGKAEWAIDVGCRPSRRVVHFTVACELISSTMEIIS